MVGSRHLDPSFIQNVKDISLKNQTLNVVTYHTKKPIVFNDKFKKLQKERESGPFGLPIGGVYPCDDREIYYADCADIDGFKGKPTIDPKLKMWFHPPCDPQHHPKGYVTAPFEMALTSPDYHIEGEDAPDKYKSEIMEYMRKCHSQVFDGLDDDNILHAWSATGREVELRNTGLIGGTWAGSRHCEDQLWGNRPCEGLERYRSPIEGLYNAHQTSGHPGGLCLMAIPYNLMHILIEDGIAQPGKWWYPSPWYIPQEGKISADPNKKSK
jgi:hypothetical protein